MNINFQINYDEEGGALVVFFEDDREFARHWVRGNVAQQWACQELACILERREEEAKWLAQTGGAR